MTIVGLLSESDYSIPWLGNRYDQDSASFAQCRPSLAAEVFPDVCDDRVTVHTRCGVVGAGF